MMNENIYPSTTNLVSSFTSSSSSSSLSLATNRISSSVKKNKKQTTKIISHPSTTKTIASVRSTQFLQQHSILTGFQHPGAALYQTIRELVENSIDAKATTIRLSLQCENTVTNSTVSSSFASLSNRSIPYQSWTIQIEDDGHGIPAESICQQLTQVFHTTKSVGETLGSENGEEENSTITTGNVPRTPQFGKFGIGLKSIILYAQSSIQPDDEGLSSLSHPTDSAVSILPYKMAPLYIATSTEKEFYITTLRLGINTETGEPIVTDAEYIPKEVPEAAEEKESSRSSNSSTVKTNVASSSNHQETLVEETVFTDNGGNSNNPSSTSGNVTYSSGTLMKVTIQGDGNWNLSSSVSRPSGGYGQYLLAYFLRLFILPKNIRMNISIEGWKPSIYHPPSTTNVSSTNGKKPSKSNNSINNVDTPPTSGTIDIEIPSLSSLHRTVENADTISDPTIQYLSDNYRVDPEYVSSGIFHLPDDETIINCYIVMTPVTKSSSPSLMKRTLVSSASVSASEADRSLLQIAQQQNHTTGIIHLLRYVNSIPLLHHSNLCAIHQGIVHNVPWKDYGLQVQPVVTNPSDASTSSATVSNKRKRSQAHTHSFSSHTNVRNSFGLTMKKIMQILHQYPSVVHPVIHGNMIEIDAQGALFGTSQVQDFPYLPFTCLRIFINVQSTNIVQFGNIQKSYLVDKTMNNVASVSSFSSSSLNYSYGVAQACRIAMNNLRTQILASSSSSSSAASRIFESSNQLQNYLLTKTYLPSISQQLALIVQQAGTSSSLYRTMQTILSPNNDTTYSNASSSTVPNDEDDYTRLQNILEHHLQMIMESVNLIDTPTTTNIAVPFPDTTTEGFLHPVSITDTPTDTSQDLSETIDTVESAFMEGEKLLHQQHQTELLNYRRKSIFKERQRKRQKSTQFLIEQQFQALAEKENDSTDENMYPLSYGGTPSSFAPLNTDTDYTTVIHTETTGSSNLQDSSGYDEQNTQYDTPPATNIDSNTEEIEWTLATIGSTVNHLAPEDSPVSLTSFSASPVTFDD